jgi:peptidoglycan/LPS O-acetylase OafA/YrhL
MNDSKRPLLPALTSARYFAALHVVLFHTWTFKGFAQAPAWFQQFASVGYVAVSFFFILSGFVLVYTYGGKDFDLGRFWRARLARLYPVYLLSLLLTAPFFFYVVLKTDSPQLAYYRSHLASTSVLVLAMQQAWVPMAAMGWNPVAWAVSTEVFFYMVFPFLLSRLSRLSDRGLATIALLGWMMPLAAALAYMVWLPDGVYPDSNQDMLFWLSALKFNPLVRLPEFMAGAACGFWFLRGKHNPQLAARLVLGGTSLALLITVFSPWIAYPILHSGLYAPAFAAIICGLALGMPAVAFLESRWLRLLGDSSYCLYLFHPMVIGIVLYGIHGRPSFSLVRVVGAILAATLVGMLLYRYVEEPARTWLRGKPPASALAVAAPTAGK